MKMFVDGHSQKEHDMKGITYTLPEGLSKSQRGAWCSLHQNGYEPKLKSLVTLFGHGLPAIFASAAGARKPLPVKEEPGRMGLEGKMAWRAGRISIGAW